MEAGLELEQLLLQLPSTCCTSGAVTHPLGGEWWGLLLKWVCDVELGIFPLHLLLLLLLLMSLFFMDRHYAGNSHAP